jgi:hypothetical protein
LSDEDVADFCERCCCLVPLLEDIAVELREVAVDRHTMLLIGSAIVAVLFIVYMMSGSGGISVPR